MEAWLEWARGPVFLFAFTFMVLGMIRHIALTIWETVRAVRRAGDPGIPYRRISRETLQWLFPVGKLKDRLLFSLTSIVFHISILIVPIFLCSIVVVAVAVERYLTYRRNTINIPQFMMKIRYPLSRGDIVSG